MERYPIGLFNARFPDEDACLDAVHAMVYPDGITCRKCERVTKHHRRAGRKQYACDYCGTLVAPLAGTIFEKSTTPLKSWFYAMYLMASTRCGISAKQLERELGVTYKTAWRMFTQIRKLFDEDSGPLSGTVEIDETYYGGKPRYRNGDGNLDEYGRIKRGPRSPMHNKQLATVIGAVERGGRIRVRVLGAGVKAATGNVMPLIGEHILPETTIYTDEAS